MDNQITTKLWIIKTFWSIYLQDNHYCKDLNIQKRGLIFRIQIKNTSNYKFWLKKPKKWSPKWTKTQTRVQYLRRPFNTLKVLEALPFFSIPPYVKDVLEALALGISFL